jgi:hypothetical protein
LVFIELRDVALPYNFKDEELNILILVRFIVLLTEAVCPLQRRSTSTRIQGAMSEKAVIVILMVVMAHTLSSSYERNRAKLLIESDLLIKLKI